MLSILALLVGAAAGFIGSRKLRKPQSAATAASVARTVGATVGRRRGLTAPELQRACFSEMVRHVRVDGRGRSRAPGQYRLLLHPDDLAVVDEARTWFTNGLVQALRDAAEQNSWAIAGAVEIDYQPDPVRRPGAPTALAVNPDDANGVDAPSPDPTASAPVEPSSSRLVLHRLDTGETTPLGTTPLTIGRGTDQAIRVDDKRVSRAHATVEPSGSGWTVTDAGSSNGTTVNGERIAPQAPRPLVANDVVRVGPVSLRVDETDRLRRRTASQPLDDQDRTRISNQVLPPDGRSHP